jgi:pyruvate,orthophosphate dikinase
MPESFKELQRIRAILEKHYRDMQDLEFTIERGKLYMLQTRSGKRTGVAAVHIAFDLHRAKRIDQKEVLRRIEPDMLVQLLAPVFEPAELERARKAGRLCGKGLPAGPGAASGVIAFSAKRAEAMCAAGKSVLLVRNETSPEDIGGMLAAVGILTSRGGMTSHAAVVARGMGKPCVVGAEGLSVDRRAGKLIADGRTLNEGDAISIDGSTGEVIAGALDPHPSEIQQVLTGHGLRAKDSLIYQRFAKLMTWADRHKRLAVRTNADTPHDATVARALGAKGIGLCRTEHMFFGPDRIAAVREMILSDDAAQRAKPLKKLLPMQRRDFVEIFRAMDGYPVTIRLLDPPLHEFLPTETAQFKGLAREMGLTVKQVEAKVESLQEANPMLGHRGCRVGITFPEIYEMQARAIFEAAAICHKKGIRVRPEVMIPLVGTVEEYRELADRIHAVAAAIAKKGGRRQAYHVGTMMEIPRACLVAGEIAAEAEFLSFGTNDLTQLTYGYSRDDVAKFLPEYLERRILPADPFQTLDIAGVGQLVRLGIASAREARKGIKVGVCGEHGGDAASVRFFHDSGADYVSCSPYRVPVARLAAAQAVLSSTAIGSTA